MTGQGKRARHIENGTAELAEVLSNNEFIRELSARFSPLVDQGKRFAMERPALAFGVTFGLGILVGSAFVSRLGRVLLLGAIGSGFELLVRAAPRALDRMLSADSPRASA